MSKKCVFTDDASFGNFQTHQTTDYALYPSVQISQLQFYRFCWNIGREVQVFYNLLTSFGLAFDYQFCTATINWIHGIEAAHNYNPGSESLDAGRASEKMYLHTMLQVPSLALYFSIDWSLGRKKLGLEIRF